MPPVPSPVLLLTVYSRDVLSRLDEVKARVTSIFGSILKMDSTKKVTKKLADTAAWVTNVGNEHGQVLVSVLTAGEGEGLVPMAAGLMERYRLAGVAPPQLTGGSTGWSASPRRIGRKEMALHCRRRTRGAAATEVLLLDLLETFNGERSGFDTLGIPLLDSIRIQAIWKEQRRHLHCIQDPPGVQLYTETGKITKGGVMLPVSRCARGSTSLESFHLHLNRFIR
ncbi:uncharacterized protein LOC135538214 [Oncorhynchus masou masou]|uniref:uncharacterized protein LOC135538214 n=1 Tax=Oncorhynchus masou masou TaxID=90313 RepID=UPI0031844AF1